MPGAAGLLICTLTSDISWGSSDLTITVFTCPNWCPPMYFRVTPGGHASVPISPQRCQNSAQQPNHSDKTSIFFPGTFKKVTYTVLYITKCIKPVFCILQVFVKGVSGGTDSPSPIVTSSTKDMDGVLAMGLSKS